MAEQQTLFDLEPPAAPRPIWERQAGFLSKMHTTWTHTPSGWIIRHCGHPTANFPYYIETQRGSHLYAPNGRGFQRLDLAKARVEQLWAGEPTPATEDLRVYAIVRSERVSNQSQPVASTLEHVTGYKDADKRRNELQQHEDRLHPKRSSWTRTIFCLQLETSMAFD